MSEPGIFILDIRDVPLPPSPLTSPEEAWEAIVHMTSTVFLTNVRQTLQPVLAHGLLLELGMLIALADPERALALVRLIHQGLGGAEALSDWSAFAAKWIAATNIETQKVRP